MTDSKDFPCCPPMDELYLPRDFVGDPPDLVIDWDPHEHQWWIRCPGEGSAPIRFCPFCGEGMPAGGEPD